MDQGGPSTVQEQAQGLQDTALDWREMANEQVRNYWFSLVKLLLSVHIRVQCINDKHTRFCPKISFSIHFTMLIRFVIRR
jgi:hypothetical protein